MRKHAFSLIFVALTTLCFGIAFLRTFGTLLIDKKGR